MKKSIKTAIFACIFAAAFQITAFAGFTWRVESAGSSYVGTTPMTEWEIRSGILMRLLEL